MALNLFTSTCKRSKSLLLFSCSFQITNRLFDQSKKNLLSGLFHYSTYEPISETFYNSTEFKKYLDFIHNNVHDFLKVTNMNTEEKDNILSHLEKKKFFELEMKSLCDMSQKDASELGDLVEEEKHNLKKNLITTYTDIFEIIVAHEEENENRNAEIQIIPGIGGSEAKLFAYQLFNMYVNYAKYKKWECCVINESTENCELSSANLLITGDFVFNHMKCEGGVHRVQRVPETEKGGRTHTSTCSIVVLPQPKPHEIIIKPQDVIVEKTTSCGPGGQNVNKRETAIRLKHLPTGIIVECQETRHQFKNKEIALEKLRGILYKEQLDNEEKERKKSKKKQAGTNDYADKIRTYNFNQGRITDHRLNFSSFNIKSFFLGENDLDEIINKFREFNKKELFLNHVKKVFDTVEYRNFEKAKQSN